MGKEFLENGMTVEQYSYFYQCCIAVEAGTIDSQTMAFARVMTDEKGQKSLNKSIDGMRASLTKYLLEI